MTRPLLIALVAALLAPAAARGAEVDLEAPDEPVAVDAAGWFALPASCAPGDGACRGDIRLYTTSQEPGEARTLAATGAAAATRLGVATFALEPGAERAIRVRLNAAGRRALARANGRAYTVRMRLREREADGSMRFLQQTALQLRRRS